MKWMEPTQEQRDAWRDWVNSRPPSVRSALAGKDPWTLYHMKSTGHRVALYSASEDGTLTVTVSGKYNAVLMERNVFGISPDDLTECDAPGADEPVGVMLSPDQRTELINAKRAENGLPPLEQEPTP